MQRACACILERLLFIFSLLTTTVKNLLKRFISTVDMMSMLPLSTVDSWRDLRDIDVGENAAGWKRSESSGEDIFVLRPKWVTFVTVYYNNKSNSIGNSNFFMQSSWQNHIKCCNNYNNSHATSSVTAVLPSLGQHGGVDPIGLKPNP